MEMVIGKTRNNWLKLSCMMKLLIKYNLRSITRKIGKLMMSLISRMMTISTKIGKNIPSRIVWHLVLRRILCRSWGNLGTIPTLVLRLTLLLMLLTMLAQYLIIRIEKNNRYPTKTEYNLRSHHYHLHINVRWNKNSNNSNNKWINKKKNKNKKNNHSSNINKINNEHP